MKQTKFRTFLQENKIKYPLLGKWLFFVMVFFLFSSLINLILTNLCTYEIDGKLNVAKYFELISLTYSYNGFPNGIGVFLILSLVFKFIWILSLLFLFIYLDSIFYSVSWPYSNNAYNRKPLFYSLIVGGIVLGLISLIFTTYWYVVLDGTEIPEIKFKLLNIQGNMFSQFSYFFIFVEIIMLIRLLVISSRFEKDKYYPKQPLKKLLIDDDSYEKFILETKIQNINLKKNALKKQFENKEITEKEYIQKIDEILK